MLERCMLERIKKAIDERIKLEPPDTDQPDVSDNNQRIYGYYQAAFAVPREKLRQFLRLMHGYPKDQNFGIDGATDDSPLMHLNRGGKVWIADTPTENTITLLKEGDMPPDTAGVLVDGKAIRVQQEQIDYIYDESKITLKQVYHIQLLKAGHANAIVVPDGKTLEGYERELESLGSYVVVRGRVWQSHEYNGNICNKLHERVLYYANFPKLAGQSKDLAYFCSDGHLREDRIPELKEKFKAVIRLQARMAAKFGEALDIVTPNAFFYGLEQHSEQPKAKSLFADAVIEFAMEEPIPGFKGLFVHGDLSYIIMQRSIEFKTKVAINNGNAASPGRISNEDALGLTVAESIMGEACGPVGNGALGNRGDRAKEENDARVLSLMQLVFGPQFNSTLLDKIYLELFYQNSDLLLSLQIENNRLSKNLHTTILCSLACIALVTALAANVGGVRNICGKFIESMVLHQSRSTIPTL